jgi:hypothetical protein
MRTLNDYFLTGTMTDVGTASSIYIPVPDDGKIIKIISVLHGAITVADSTVTTSVNATSVTGGSLTVSYSGSAAGDIDTAEPTANNNVKEGDFIKLTTDGACSSVAAITFTVIIRR